MRTQLTRSITLFSSSPTRSVAVEGSPLPTDDQGANRAHQRWTGVLVFGTSLAFVLFVPLLRHLH